MFFKKKAKKFGCSLIIFFTIFFLFSYPEFTVEQQLASAEEFTGENKAKNAIPKKNNKKIPVEVSADKLEMKEDKNIIMGEGNVDIYYKDIHIHADRVQLNSKSGKTLASGHVVIEDKTSRITGEKTFFNFNSRKGEIFNAEGNFLSEYFFSGKKIKKVGKDKYKIYNGTLTTCFGEKPAWLFKCDYADLTIENYAFLKNPSFWIKDVPVFYLPYGYIPLKTKRATGFLFPNIGSSSKDGIFINNSFFWAINNQMDATFYLDYMEKKGVRPGLEFRYIPTRQMSGQFNGSYLEEKDTRREFWKIEFNHNQEFNYGIKALAKVDLLSDNNYDKAFEDSTIARTRRISDSHLTLSKNWENRSLEILTRFRKSIELNREEKFNLLPQITFRNQREKFLKSPLYFNLESSYTGFERKINAVDIDTQRVDFHPQFSLPFNTLPWLTFTPTVGFRETFYSQGNDSSGNKTGSFSRELYDINTVFEGPKFFKIFNFKNASTPKIKHILEPRIIHSYIPDIDNDDRNKIFVFDNIDSIGPLNNVQYSLTNRFLKKFILNQDSFTTEEFLRFEISQSYDFREATKTLTAGAERRPFSDIRWDLDSNIWTPLYLNFDGTYDVYDRFLKTANVELGITPESFWSLYFERRYTKDTSTFVMGTLGLDFKKGWGTKYSARYDELNEEFQENDFSIIYSAQCWNFSLDFVNRNNFINGQKETENKFFFLITLKGIGSVGKKKNIKLLHRGL